MKNFNLEKEDYAEPRCPFCTDFYSDKKTVEAVDLGRIFTKLDEYFSHNDYFSAEKHLLYWLDEAQSGNDAKGELAITNELMGLYRKTGKKEKAIQYAENALCLLKELDIEARADAGTTYTNSATVYKSFGMADKSIPVFKKAEKLYDDNLSADDIKKGALYNNMALAYADLKEYDNAKIYYNKALDVMAKNKNGELECAITYLNMADCLEAEKGYEKSEQQITQYIEKAYSLLKTDGIEHNGYYAFVCEKCAPSFGYYGYFAYENELKKIAGSIYERA